jgi:hypothetical protein
MNPGLYCTHTAKIGAEVFGLSYEDFAAQTSHFTACLPKLLVATMTITCGSLVADHGVPRLGGRWGRPSNPKNIRSSPFGDANNVVRRHPRVDRSPPITRANSR